MTSLPRARRHRADRNLSPWLLLVMAAGLLLAVDAALFHSGIYTRILKPDSYAGRLQLLVHRELRRADSPFRDVLLLGDSRCAEGFSEKQALQLLESSRLRVHSGALNGSTPRVWYYLMRELLQGGRQYAAVVVALDSFRDLDDGVDPASRRSDLQSLAPVLGILDTPDFAASYPGWRDVATVGASLILKGHAYKEDLRDFLSAPMERWSAVESYRRNFARWRFNYPGREEQMGGLEYDPESRDFVFHQEVSTARKSQARRQLKRAFSAQTGEQHRYRRIWLGRLVNLLRAHSIPVLFIRLPRHPAFPLAPSYRRAPSAVAGMGEKPGVRVFAEDEFARLDRQEFFFDPLHLNRTGRERFTQSLVDLLQDAL